LCVHRYTRLSDGSNRRTREQFRCWFRFPLNVPFEEKDAAKELGAKWDATKKLWYAPMAVLAKGSPLRELLLYPDQISDIVEHHEQQLVVEKEE
jgi:hypothetical protein